MSFHKESGSLAISERANVTIVDPRQLFREALKSLLESSGLIFVGEGGSVDEALRHLESKNRLDLLICHFYSMDELEQELDRIREARLRFDGVRTVILSDCLSTPLLLRAMQIGVDAFLPSHISMQVLQRALELVLLGQHLFPAALAQHLLSREEPAMETRAPPPGPLPLRQGALDRRRAITLSTREHQILCCLVDGLSNKVIARALNITEATVKVHIKGLLRKTGVANRTQAAIWALHKKLDLESAAVGSEPAWPRRQPADTHGVEEELNGAPAGIPMQPAIEANGELLEKS